MNEKAKETLGLMFLVAGALTTLWIMWKIESKYRGSEAFGMGMIYVLVGVFWIFGVNPLISKLTKIKEKGDCDGR